MTLSTYLNFDGNCREAFEYYRSVFGGEFMVMETFRNGRPTWDCPRTNSTTSCTYRFPIGSSVLMGSDMPSTFGPSHKPGNNFSISISATSREQSDDLFGKLSKGGSVNMPMQDMFWGSYFGACTDKFGINWQVNCEPAQE